MLFSILLLLILFAAVALLHDRRVWNNSLLLINVVTAALLATNYWEPLANLFDGFLPRYAYYIDFVAIWVLFAAIAAGMVAATKAVAPVHVRLMPIVDRIGGALLAVWVGWVLVCFTAMTLHLVPLSRNYLGFTPEKPLLLGLVAPDRLWLGFMQKMSQGSYAQFASAEDARNEAYVFDARGQFVVRYAQRRSDLERAGAGAAPPRR